MSIREEVVEADLSLVEGPDESWSLPEARPRAEPDRCALHEREQARAAAAEARVQELLNDIRRLRAALRKAGGGKGAREPLPRDVRRLHKALEGIVKLTGCRLISAFLYEAKPLKLSKTAIDNLPIFRGESG